MLRTQADNRKLRISILSNKGSVALSTNLLVPTVLTNLDGTLTTNLASALVFQAATEGVKHLAASVKKRRAERIRREVMEELAAVQKAAREKKDGGR